MSHGILHVNEDHSGAKSDGAELLTQPVPPVSSSCRGRHIINSDQVECLSLQSKGCKFVLGFGKARICFHPQRQVIAARK